MEGESLMAEEGFINKEVYVVCVVINKTERGDGAGCETEILHQPAVGCKCQLSLVKLFLEIVDLQL
jgi:hypothetical protein